MKVLSLATGLLIGVLASSSPVNAQIRRNALPPVGSTEKATSDFVAGKPLPGLPDLYKPVYLAQWSIACKTLGQLRNPNIGVLLQNQMCGVDTKSIPVSVLPPEDGKQYVDSHVFGAVRVQLLLPKGQSDGSIERRWVYIEDLSNDPARYTETSLSKSALMTYNYFKPVDLVGVITEKLAVACCRQGKEMSTKYLALELDRSIDVVPSNPNAPEADELPEKSIKAVQLTTTQNGLIARYTAMKGQRARVTCSLFHAENGHHLTSVLCDVTNVSKP